MKQTRNRSRDNRVALLHMYRKAFHRMALGGMMLAGVTGVARGQDGSSPAPADIDEPPRDIVSIAKIEAERERLVLSQQVTALLAELRSSSDHNLSFVQSKIQDLARIGPTAIPQLLGAMNHEDFAPGAVNAGINASRAIAEISGQQVIAELTHLAREGGMFGRRNAARALGLRGDATVFPVLKDLLSQDDQTVVRESLLAIGSIGAPSSEQLVVGYLDSIDLQTCAAAVEALRRLNANSSSDAMLNRMRKELGTEQPNDQLLTACLAYLTSMPRLDSVELLTTMLSNPNTPVGLRLQTIETLEATGLQLEVARRPVILTLEASCRGGLQKVVRAAAFALFALGDDSGVDAVTADLDLELDRNPRNFNARYKRAEIYLQFHRWRDASKDLLDGLKVEKDPRDPDRIHLLLARSYAGMERFNDSSRYLRRLPRGDLPALPDQYPEFQNMAKDSRHRALFHPES